MCGDGQPASLSPDFRCHNEILSLNFDNDMLFTMLVCVFFLYHTCAKSLKMQVIALTEELLATAKQNAISLSETGTFASASPNFLQSKENKTVS